LKEIGVIHMKQRRGDTRRKSFGGKIVFIARNSLEEAERKKICISWSKPNAIVVKRSSSNILIKAGKTEIHHVLAQNFGRNASMEEGANIAFAKSDGMKKGHFLLYFDDVQEFTNSEWQGGREKMENDACYLKCKQDVVELNDGYVYLVMAMVPIGRKRMMSVKGVMVRQNWKPKCIVSPGRFGKWS
jgi:hypothetical protein